MNHSGEASEPTALGRLGGRAIMRLVALACLVPALVSCSQPPVPRDQFYRLGAMLPSQAAATS